MKRHQANLVSSQLTRRLQLVMTDHSAIPEGPRSVSSSVSCCSSESGGPTPTNRHRGHLYWRKMVYGVIFVLGMSLITAGLAVFPTYSRSLGVGLVVCGVVVFVASAVLADACAAHVYATSHFKPPEYEAVVPKYEEERCARNSFVTRAGSYRLPEERQIPYRTGQCKWCSWANWTRAPIEQYADGYWREPVFHPWWRSSERDESRSSSHRFSTLKTASVHVARSPGSVALDSADVDRSPLFSENAAAHGQGDRLLLPPHASCDDSETHPSRVSHFEESCGEMIGAPDRSSRQFPPSYDAVLAGDAPVLAPARAQFNYCTL